MNRRLTPTLRVAGLVLGAAAAAAAALGSGVATGTTSAAFASQTTAGVAACATSQLRVWYGEPPGAAAGSVYLPVEFSNVSGTTCALSGFPGVSGVTINGGQLGSPARWNHVIQPRTVVLAPGATAHVILQIVNTANYPASVCGPTKAYGLRVYPPNQRASVVLPLAFEACAKAGPIYLGVDPVNAGVGIPLNTGT